MISARAIAVFLSMLLVGSGVAQEHQHGNSEKLGTVHFATSCQPAAQMEFDRAVALLHSFQFSAAIQGFNAALKLTRNAASLTGASRSANGVIHSQWA